MQASLGGVVDNLQRIRAFLRVRLSDSSCLVYASFNLKGLYLEDFKLILVISSMQVRLRDYGLLDFDAYDLHRQPPVDTTWQQVLNILSDN